jgi:hypothetical protein
MPFYTDGVLVDSQALKAALDGRTQSWLARRVGVSQTHIWCLAHGRRRASPHVYAAMRAALPALPPAPEPAANGHKPREEHASE